MTRFGARASTGRRAATPRSHGTPKATPTCRARCSSVARRRRRTRTCRVRFFVFRSTGNDGASWNFPGRPWSEFNDVAGVGAQFLDKQLHDGRRPHRQPLPGPRLRDLDVRAPTARRTSTRRYRTTTASTSAARCSSAPTALCAANVRPRRPRSGAATRTSSRSRSPAPTARCTWRWPTSTTCVAGDATTGTRCCSSGRPTAARSFSAPVKVGDYFDLPDCATYQGGADAGRACVPEKVGHALGLPGDQLPVGRRQPEDPSQSS